MDLETLLAFPVTSPQEELMHVSFTPANIEYFRRKALEATFKAGRVEPNMIIRNFRQLKLQSRNLKQIPI